MPDDRSPAIPDQPQALADGTLLRDGAGRYAVAVGGVLVRFADADELTACGYDRQRVLTVPGRFGRGDGPPVDGTLVQGRDGQSCTPVAVIVGRARLDFASEAELEATRERGIVNGVPVPVFRGLAVVPADGTLCRGGVDPAGRFDPRPVALLLGGARIPFESEEELSACGYGGLDVWTLPSRVYDGFATHLPAGVRLVSPGDPWPWTTVAGGRRVPAAASFDPAWLVPDRVLRAIPSADAP